VGARTLPGKQALEAHQHTLFRHLKMRFSAETWAKICLKSVFCRKSYKITAASGVPPQKHLLAFSGWGLHYKTLTF